MNKFDYFISFTGTDLQIAEEVYQSLSKKKKVFLSTSLKPGDNWGVELPKILSISRYIISLVPQNLELGYYAQEEVAYAIDCERKYPNRYTVIPVYMHGFPDDSSKIPFGLRLKQSIDGSKYKTISDLTHHLLSLSDGKNLNEKIKIDNNEHPLLSYPTGPMVEPEDVDVSIIHAFASLLQPFEFNTVIAAANKLRRSADLNSLNNRTTFINPAMIPPAASVPPFAFWASTFDQARLNGPRMLASLLMTVPSDLFKKEARIARDNLLIKLKLY